MTEQEDLHLKEEEIISKEEIFLEDTS